MFYNYEILTLVLPSYTTLTFFTKTFPEPAATGRRSLYSDISMGLSLVEQ